MGSSVNENLRRELTDKMYLHCRNSASCAKKVTGKKVEPKKMFFCLEHGVKECWAKSEKQRRSRLTEVLHNLVRC